MKSSKSVLILTIVLLMSVFTIFSCGKKEEEQIHEIDKKYLSESQLFALHQAIEQDPDNAENFYRRAKVYYDRQDFTKALKDIDKALELKNTESRYYLLKAKLLESKNDIPSALKNAMSADAIKSNDAETSILLSRLYFTLKDIDKGQQYLNQAALLAPYHAEIYFLKGKSAALTGDTSLAISSYFTAIKKDTINIEAYKELASIYFIKQRYDSSMVFVTNGRMIKPEDPFFYYMEGKFLDHFNLKESSINSYLNSLQLNPDFLESHKALALLYYKNGNMDGATRHFQSELKINPNSIPSNIYLSEIYEKQGRGQLAIPLFERVLTLDSTNKKAKAELERLYVLYPKPKPVVKDSVVTPTPAPDTTKKAIAPPAPKAEPVAPVKPEKPVEKTIEKKTEPKKEIKKFTPIIRNPDSSKIETRPDTVK